MGKKGKKGRKKDFGLKKQIRQKQQDYGKRWYAGTLTRKELERYPHDEQVAYLSPLVRRRHLIARDESHPDCKTTIGGWFACLHCAKADVFEDGYVSES